ncbi:MULTISPECIES: type I-B CRISPR-associated protein Cas8b/Csh1 [Methanothermobacter]|uniref:type I-B CRISPR-associated protein Cas8b/Csh1 n=1 Tax=Methanothermobacter TaxID=145260 RepID=UPI001366DDE4|nr:MULTISPECIES: type I-B CRISPR-associated protein Cas8b/Csh1 [Methanothermobacter]MDI6702065.1 type I-B CRISPR-associated protein Cas8b/Csh1 [Methanothermobacter wolfeii]MDI6882835.1 type I-B CRISPR-associated protein Cas8b/Csh1 [Methanothermobacter sp.]QHN06820.1 type I-B CRISPR-associated protein Cas8b/Csh1 [Methanothermobacter sp. THM-1]
MLTSVRDLGKYLRIYENISAERAFIEANKLSGIKHVICAVFIKENHKLKYEGIHLEQFTAQKVDKYLYRQFRHRLWDTVPTSRVQTPDKLIDRLKKWFITYAGKKNNFWGDELIKKLNDVVIDKNGDLSEDIKQDIVSILEEIPKREINNTLFTVKIREGEAEKYPGDIEIFKKIFREESLKKFYERKFDKEIISKGVGTCYLCGESKEVYGFASPFSVYTVMKKGFASNFVQENSWKQLPLCEDCGINLEIGKEFINNYLSKSFFEYNFYVIPYYVVGDINDVLIEEIKDDERRLKSRSLLSLEDDILDILKENKDFLVFIFVFYKRGQGDNFDIHKYVEDVPPSWIKALFEAFYGVEKSIFEEEQLKMILGDKWSGDLIDGSWDGKSRGDMTLGGLIKTFFKDHDNFFLDTVGNILAQRSLNRGLIVSFFIKQIRTEHVNDRDFGEKLLCLKSLYLLEFLNRLDLLGVNNMDKLRHSSGEVENTVVGKIDSFFKEFENVFDTPEKRAVFLQGVLTKFLLDVQYAQRKSTPFRSKLKGLKLDRRDIRRLLPEVTEKLREYRVAYPLLEEEVSKYLIETENSGWKLSKDDISYYFALGINLGGAFKEKKGVYHE